MENLSTFCSCTNLACFFNLVEGTENRAGDSFEDFAKYVLRK